MQYRQVCELVILNGGALDMLAIRGIYTCQRTRLTETS